MLRRALRGWDSMLATEARWRRWCLAMAGLSSVLVEAATAEGEPGISSFNGKGEVGVEPFLPCALAVVELFVRDILNGASGSGWPLR